MIRGEDGHRRAGRRHDDGHAIRARRRGPEDAAGQGIGRGDGRAGDGPTAVRIDDDGPHLPGRRKARERPQRDGAGDPAGVRRGDDSGRLASCAPHALDEPAVDASSRSGADGPDPIGREGRRDLPAPSPTAMSFAVPPSSTSGRRGSIAHAAGGGGTLQRPARHISPAPHSSAAEHAGSAQAPRSHTLPAPQSASAAHASRQAPYASQNHPRPAGAQVRVLARTVAPVDRALRPGIPALRGGCARRPVAAAEDCENREDRARAAEVGRGYSGAAPRGTREMAPAGTRWLSRIDAGGVRSSRTSPTRARSLST